MAKMTIGQKSERVLKLVLGMRNPRVGLMLKPYGFSDRDREDGFNRLRALSGGKFALKPNEKQDPTLLRRLDQWENLWFPIAAASLRTRFSEVHAWLFLNLTQTEGPALVLSMGTFIDRLARMAAEAGPRGAEARAFLAERGLTEETIAIARDILGQLGASATDDVQTIDPQVQAEAEANMWAWYLEWSEIVRVAIRDRRLLRELGFLTYRRRVDEPDMPAEPAGAEDNTLPK